MLSKSNGDRSSFFGRNDDFIIANGDRNLCNENYIVFPELISSHFRNKVKTKRFTDMCIYIYIYICATARELICRLGRASLEKIMSWYFELL